MNIKAVPGAVFGRLTVKSVDGLFSICACSCGNADFRCRKNNLQNNTTKSCGCLRREAGLKNKTHGLTKTNLYAVWDNLRQRCMNPNDKAYASYGGRGIKVCERWDSFTLFVADMGEKPSSKHSIDRIDNDGDYSPDNCRWATKTEQNRNRRNTIKVTHEGVTKPLAEWCSELGINYATAHGRLKKGKLFCKTLPRPAPVPGPVTINHRGEPA